MKYFTISFIFQKKNDKKIVPMMRTNLAPVFLILLSISLSSGSTYYVSPVGDDDWDGSYEHPWATPGYGSKNISGGDTLIILSGEYVMETFYDDMITPPSGSFGAPTVVIGQGATKPRMLGRGSLFACVQIDGSDGCFIEIKNLELTSFIDTPYTGGCREGINAYSDSGYAIHDLKFEDITIQRVEEMGMDIGGDAENILIKRCDIFRTGYTCIGGPGAYGDGWVNVVIDSCYLGYAGHFYHGVDTVAWVWDRPDGVGFEESEGPVEIRYTISEHQMGDGLDSKSKRTYIHHCIVANNYADGVKLWGDSSFVENTLVYGTGGAYTDTTPWCLLVIDTDDPDAYFEITNCTFWDSPLRPPHYAATIQYDFFTNPITLVMRNCIFQAQRQILCQPVVNFQASNNLFFINDTLQITANGTEYYIADISALGTDNIYGNPHFVDPQWGTEGDFHLEESSPAIDAGVSVAGLTDDLDFYPRPYAGVFDIGCYEWHETTVISEKSEATDDAELFVYYDEISSNIVLHTNESGKFEIFDIKGRLCVEGDVVFSKARVNFSSMSSGVYFVRFVLPDNTAVLKKVAVLK